MAAAPRIGILDSGLGGLSVLRELRLMLPGAVIDYVADSAHCPYGPKPAEFIRTRVAELSDFLLDRGAELVVVACNSATIVAVEALRASYPVPVVGMEPAVKPAVRRTRAGIVGVLATEASLAGEKYHRLVATHGGGVRIVTRAAPEFVELVEAGILEGPAVDEAVERHAGALLAEGADVLVLGCTHYPFLRPAIERRAGAGVEVIDTGAAVAAQVCRRLGLAPAVGSDRHGDGEGPPIACFTSAASEGLGELLGRLLPGVPVGEIAGLTDARGEL